MTAIMVAPTYVLARRRADLDAGVSLCGHSQARGRHGILPAMWCAWCGRRIVLGIVTAWGR